MDQVADERTWDIVAASNLFAIRALNDTQHYAANALTVHRGSGVTISDVTVTPPLIATSSVATPRLLAITDNNVVANLNADLLDGSHSSSFAAARHSHDAMDLVSSIVDSARLPTAGPVQPGIMTATAQSFSGAKTFAGKPSSTSIVSSLNQVTTAPNVTFDCSAGNTQRLMLSSDVVGSSLANCSAGQTITFVVCQDIVGGHSFSWPVAICCDQERRGRIRV